MAQSPFSDAGPVASPHEMGACPAGDKAADIIESQDFDESGGATPVAGTLFRAGFLIPDGVNDARHSLSQPQSTLPASGGVSLPSRASSNGCYLGLKNPTEPHANRKASNYVNQQVHKGDVAYFSGNHAQMCVGFNDRGEALWCSDTYQGTNFYCNAACQNGTFVIYRNNDPSFDADKAARTLMERAAPDYTGNCARAVRENGIEAGGGRVTHRWGTAAEYVSGGLDGFHIVADSNGPTVAVARNDPPANKTLPAATSAPAGRSPGPAA